MASQSRLPQPGRDNRRSFLPAPSKLTRPREASPTGDDRRNRTRLSVGDHVCIGGVKHGHLKYLGEVHLAPGTWCGIELDDPDGKHDGEVEGHRYFYCRKLHGVFAPIDKVDLLETSDSRASEITEKALKRKSLPVPQYSALHKTELQKSRPVSAGSESDIRKQAIHFEDDNEQEINSVQSTKAKSNVIQQKSQIAKISGIPRVGLAANLPHTQLKQQDAASAPDLRDKTNDSQTDIKRVSYYQSQDRIQADVISDNEQVPDDVNKSRIIAPAAADQQVSRLQKPSRLPGASRLPTKFSKLDRSSPTETKPPLIDGAKSSPKLSDTFSYPDKNKTFEVDEGSTNTTESQENLEEVGAEDSSDLTRQLRSDSRQFLNITFDAANNGGVSPASLPDVVSSASTSPDSHNSSQSEGEHDSQNTRGNTDESALDLLDDEAMWDNTDLLDGLDRESKTPKQKSNIVASTPLPVSKTRKYSDMNKTYEMNVSSGRDLCSKIDESVGAMNATYEMDDTGDAPTVGEKCDLIDTVESAHNMSSDSLEGSEEGLVDALDSSDDHTFLIEKGITDVSMPFSVLEEVKELDKTKLEDILEGMSNSMVIDLEKAFDGNEKPMVDSGIMDSGALNRRSMTESGIVLTGQENRRSMTESQVEDIIRREKKPMIDSGISDGSMTRSQQLDLDDQQRLEADLVAGHVKKERPISLISTTSADTGYVPDTDSEAGTLTTNSPLDWMEKHGGMVTTLASVQEQDDSYRNSFNQGVEKCTEVILKETEEDSDYYGATRTDTETGPGESDLDDTHLPIPEFEISGLSPLKLDDSVHQTSTAQAPSPSSVDSSLVEDDRAEADQIHHSSKGDNQESSPENTLKDLSDASPDAIGAVMPIEESVLPGDITAASQSEQNDTSQDSSTVLKSEVLDDSVCTASGSTSHDVSGIDANNESLNPTSEADGSAIENNVEVSKTPKQKFSSKKKTVIVEHKKPNIKVRSSLADYIHSPVPTKPKEKKEDTKTKKHTVNKKHVDNKKQEETKLEDADADGKSEERKRIRSLIEKEPPKIIKRTPPKSKWDNIMSQIDSTKVPKPKPKSEIKSKLEIYLSTPAPQKEREKEPKKEVKPRSKLISTPKPDYSKVKSKLSLSAPPPKREHSPAGNKATNSSRLKSPKPTSRLFNGNVHPDLSESLDNSVGSARSSRTDLSVDNTENEGPHHSKLKAPRGSLGRITRNERRGSNASNVSEVSQGSVQLQNAKNKKNDQPKPETPRVKKYSNIKSSIPPPAPRKPPPSKSSLKKTSEASDASKTSPKKNSNSNRSRTARTPGKVNSHSKGSPQPDLVSNSLRPSPEKEISRLETLCENRTKELNVVKMHLKNSTQAFDAMTCLFKYLTQDLDAFSCPLLAEQLQHVQEDLKEAHSNIEELKTLKSRLEEEISELTKAQGESAQEMVRIKEEIVSLNKAHETATTELREEHERALLAKVDALEKQHAERNSKAKDHHEHVISYMKDCHDRNVSDINLDHQRAIDSLRLSHLEDIEKLRTKHDTQMEELHKQHRDRLEDITHRFETIKTTLGEKVETLKGECDYLKTRARVSEEALLRDTDVKVQFALQPFLNLPAEIESLKLVIEMRNEEIQKLRKQNMDLEKQLEELPIAKEKIASIQQKAENLEAIINIKTDHEKQLHEKCQNLMRKYDRESKANKRLSMDYEQLMWKVDQDFGSTESLYRRQLSRSPPRSESGSPDLTRKGLSPITSEVDSPSPRRSHRSTSSMGEDSFERKLKRRSATFVLEKEKSSPSASPQAKRLSPSSFSTSPPQVMSQSAGELSYSTSPLVNSSPDSSSLSVSQSMSQSMTQSMTQSMDQSLTGSDIFGDFESSGILLNGQEISVSVCLPEKEAGSEVFPVEQSQTNGTDTPDKQESDV